MISFVCGGSAKLNDFPNSSKVASYALTIVWSYGAVVVYGFTESVLDCVVLGSIPAPSKLFLLLSLWTALRSNLSSAKQWVSQMQLAVTSRAKYYKKY